jgi:surface antigen
MVEQVLTAVAGISILAGAYLIDLLVGIAKVAFTPDLKWSWRKMFQDMVKAILIAVGIVGFVAVLNALTWFGTQTGADLSFLGDCSFPVLIAGIIGGSGWYLTGALKNILKFINGNNVKVEIDESRADYKAVSDVIIKTVADLFTPKEAVEAHKDYEEKGAQGYSYSVPIGSYDDFRNAVMGRGFDIDGYYGYQCWDGAALLWQQIGRSLSTGGTGAAKGTWTVVSVRNANAGNDFELITSVNNIKRGDVIVFGNGTYGHIAFVDQVSPLRILGQNQTGTGTGAPFNVITTSTTGFLGAFRFKKWNNTPAPAPTPTPTPTPQPTPTVPNNPTGDIKVGDSVVAWGVGTADSFGGGAQTRHFPETTMKVIGINNGRYALNQYNSGTPGVVADTTGWWPADQVRKP